MIKNIAIVSLSSGILGENYIKYETEIGFQRLKEFGVNVKCMPNAFTPDQANRLKEAMKPQAVRVQGKQGPAAGLP